MMPTVFRFGEFELNPSTYELRSRSLGAVRLERLPMDALILLVTANGRLVSRQDLRAALWPVDVFLDDESAINTVIRKVRRALGDDSESPRFIETVVGRGYRFLAVVDVIAVSRPDEVPVRPPVAPPGRVPLVSKVVLGAIGASLVVGLIASARVRTPGITAGTAPAPETTPTASGERRPVLPAAYDVYVRGRYAWNKRTEPDLRAALRLFQSSLDADPTYAPAYVGLADTYAQLGYGSFVTPVEAFPLAREAARRAIQLDPTVGDAHAALGYALMYYDWDFTGAAREFTRAIELAPNEALAHQWRAYLWTATERPLADAEAEIAEARRCDPLSVAINTDRAYILHYYGRQAEAAEAAEVALQMNPGFPLAYFWLGRIYTEQHRYAEAAAALSKIGPLRTWTPAMAALGYLYARTGRRDDAQRILDEFDGLTRTGRYASSYAKAVVYAGLDERARVFALLDDAVAERSHWLVWLKRDPRWNDLRGDPRFSMLLRRVGLPQ